MKCKKIIKVRIWESQLNEKLNLYKIFPFALSINAEHHLLILTKGNAKSCPLISKNYHLEGKSECKTNQRPNKLVTMLVNLKTTGLLPLLSTVLMMMNLEFFTKTGELKHEKNVERVVSYNQNAPTFYIVWEDNKDINLGYWIWT